MKKYLVLLLIALAQIGVVAWMIGSRERTLANGREVKFVTRPVDPSDPFRGRYVALNFEAETFKTDMEPDLKSGEAGYAVFKVDAEGYASIVTLVHEPPSHETRYFPVSVRYTEVNAHPNTGSETNAPARTYMLKFPFDRYYMNEKAAPEAESAYREANRVTRGEEKKEMTRDNYLAVRILDGKAVAEHLYIKGQPIEKLLGQAK
jgi:uncharacterized membrane-anchored protein